MNHSTSPWNDKNLRFYLQPFLNPVLVISHISNQIHFACAQGNVDLMKLLLDASNERLPDYAVLRIVTSDGESALHWAVANGEAEAVEFCINNRMLPFYTYPLRFLERQLYTNC